MDENALKLWAEALQRGELSLPDFLARVNHNGVAATQDATLDMDRQRRCGFPEVVFGQGKSPESVVEIIHSLHQSGVVALVTRVSAEQAELVAANFSQATHNVIARTLVVPPEGNRRDERYSGGRVSVISAGTSDRPMAEEAWETANWMGVQATLLQDLGVAGPQRILDHVSTLREADAVVVTAGMEGALPSVVAGHVACPVIAVPTSVGYGASFGGVAALLGMLNSCAANVAVVNIDAGFKGGYLAGMIASRAAAAREIANMAHTGTITPANASDG
ncbi:MAG: nickel pincer cofactor biosynthesis protein LarB [Pirellulales bacterium]|nr:nickel pincer cofactor biosynthesis protein LarB [Pirellulales bacterium]